MSHSGSSNVPEEAQDNERQLPALEAEEEEYATTEEEDEEQMPEWLQVLVRTRFWEPCEEHGDENRGEDCLFCLRCYAVVCPHCTHRVPGHRLLKIRRYVYRSVINVRDLQQLNIDVSRVQSYVINGQRGVHLRPMKRSVLFRPPAGAPRCVTCNTWLRNTPHLFCSLVCQGKANVSPDDFSATEAERRYRSMQNGMLQEPPNQPNLQLDDPDVADDQHPLEPSDEAPAGNQQPPEPPQAPPMANGHQPVENGSFRRRPRKQVLPARAPFF
ncbi:hypothetical protein ACP70R_017187 [Stipagrostis hirtigluma subsp. patula]